MNIGKQSGYAALQGAEIGVGFDVAQTVASGVVNAESKVADGII